MLACLVGASLLGYTAQQGQQGQIKKEVFDASTCKGVSGTDHDGEWCVANCGKDTNPICPTSFCECEGTMPTPEELGTDSLTPEEKADKKKVDDAVAERDAGFAAAQAERDAAIAKRDEEIAKAAQSDRDAEIAKRDADIAARQPAVAETAPTDTAAAPVAVAEPEASPAAPAVDWATGAELPQAPTAAPFPVAPVAAAPEAAEIEDAAQADPDASPDPWAEAAAAAAKATADAAAAAANPAAGTAAAAPTPMPFPEYNAPEQSAPVVAPPPAETLGGGSVTAYEGSGLDEDPDKHQKN